MNIQKQAMQEDNSELLMKLIKVYTRKKAYGKISISDYCWLKMAEQYLFSELSEVLCCDYNEINVLVQNNRIICNYPA